MTRSSIAVAQASDATSARSGALAGAELPRPSGAVFGGTLASVQTYDGGATIAGERGNWAW